jgi:predicted dehydrogenase
MVWTAAVIGAGAIGAALDEPRGRVHLTHAGGYTAHQDFVLVGLVDPDEVRAAREGARWGVPAFDDPNTMVAVLKPDVISICAPTDQHEVLVKLAMDSGARAIVCEKPLGPDLEASRRLAGMAAAWNGLFLVNYTRRFVPFYTALAKRLRSGQEEARSMVVKYAKGISHNGSHALDLARFLFGEPTVAVPLSFRNDFWAHDPTVSAFLRYTHCPEVFLQGLDERTFTFFECDIVTRSGRYVINEDGFTVSRYAIREHPHYHCHSLGLVAQEDTGHGRAMTELLDHVAAMLMGRPVQVRCSAADALRAQELAWELVSRTARVALL